MKETMCSGSRMKPCPSGLIMEVSESGKEGFLGRFSLLLELSASDDLVSFRFVVEEEGRDIDESSYWYGRRIGSKKMGFEERTPLMVAAMFGSKQVLTYILGTGTVDINRACGSDGATALHCAVAGGSPSSVEVIKLLLDASADTGCVDANGNRPSDLIVPFSYASFISRKKMIEGLLAGGSDIETDYPEEGKIQQEFTSEKKEYPIDICLPDIKTGIYGTDEFRMFTFKVKPCSRAYSHDWTECPFVHPGENARRRDPRKYHYSCVPCPEFRKGTCKQGDACEYAHGIFECWLHPAQYRTRLCKDEVGCTRKVCFFAHKPEELRPLYASTGSAVPSPRSYSNGASALDMMSMSSLSLGSPSFSMPPTSTPPMSPSGASSPMGMAGSMWQNQLNIVPPTLQLPGSRLKTAMNARDMNLESELRGIEYRRRQHQDFLMEEMSGLSSPSGWNNSGFGASPFERSMDINSLGGVKPTNLDEMFGSLDHAMMNSNHMQSPTGIQMRQNMNQQLRSSYPTSLSSSPVRASLSFGNESPSNTLAASRAAAFANRSHSFVDRSAVNRLSGFRSGSPMNSNLSDWGSPSGKVEWGIQREELNKLRKSASFGNRSSGSSAAAASAASMFGSVDEPDVSWVQSLVKDGPSTKPGLSEFEKQQQLQQQHDYHLNSGGPEILPSWAEQLYKEQEQMVA